MSFDCVENFSFDLQESFNMFISVVFVVSELSRV